MKNQKVHISVRGSRSRKSLSLMYKTGWNTEKTEVKKRKDEGVLENKRK